MKDSGGKREMKGTDNMRVTYRGGGAICEGNMTPSKEDPKRKRCRRAIDMQKL
jgi:hypothetical protein